MAAAAPSVDSDDPVERGRALLRARDLDAAAVCFAEALARSPLSVEANEGAATIAYLQKDYDRAATHFEAAARADARRADPLINLGAVQNRLKQYQAAIKTLQKALSRDRKSADAYFNLGIACRGANQLTMATNAYKEAIRLRSDFAEAHQNLGLVYLEVGNSRQAVASLQRALELCPTLSRAKAGLARANAESTRGAGNPFGRLVEPPPDSPSVTSGRITLSEGARSKDRARIVELSGRLQRSLEAVLTEVRGTTEPACQQTCRIMTEGRKSPRDFVALADKLEGTLGQCGRLLDLIDEHVAALQEHESEIASQMRATA